MNPLINLGMSRLYYAQAFATLSMVLLVQVVLQEQGTDKCNIQMRHSWWAATAEQSGLGANPDHVPGRLHATLHNELEAAACDYLRPTEDYHHVGSMILGVRAKRRGRPVSRVAWV